MVEAERALVYGAVAIAMTVIGSLAGVGRAATTADDRPILVFAGASLKNALDAATETFTRESAMAVTVPYAATSTLAKQIEAGAPADAIIKTVALDRGSFGRAPRARNRGDDPADA